MNITVLSTEIACKFKYYSREKYLKSDSLSLFTEFRIRGIKHGQIFKIAFGCAFKLSILTGPKRMLFRDIAKQDWIFYV